MYQQVRSPVVQSGFGLEPFYWTGDREVVLYQLLKVGLGEGERVAGTSLSAFTLRHEMIKLNCFMVLKHCVSCPFSSWTHTHEKVIFSSYLWEYSTHFNHPTWSLYLFTVTSPSLTLSPLQPGLFLSLLVVLRSKKFAKRLYSWAQNLLAQLLMKLC